MMMASLKSQLREARREAANAARIRDRSTEIFYRQIADRIEAAIRDQERAAA